MIRTISLVGAASVALTACGQPEPLVLTPPPALLTCTEEPAPPSLPERDGSMANQLERDRIMLDGYLKLRSAYGSCKAAVVGVAAWVDEVSE